MIDPLSHAVSLASLWSLCVIQTHDTADLSDLMQRWKRHMSVRFFFSFFAGCPSALNGLTNKKKKRWFRSRASRCHSCVAEWRTRQSLETAANLNVSGKEAQSSWGQIEIRLQLCLVNVSRIFFAKGLLFFNGKQGTSSFYRGQSADIFPWCFLIVFGLPLLATIWCVFMASWYTILQCRYYCKSFSELDRGYWLR